MYLSIIALAKTALIICTTIDVTMYAMTAPIRALSQQVKGDNSLNTPTKLSPKKHKTAILIAIGRAVINIIVRFLSSGRSYFRFVLNVMTQPRQAGDYSAV